MNDSKIQILEKPDWVSWDEIHEVLVKAHAQNRANGINMKKPSLPGEKIAKEIGKEGKMFVAVEGNKVVGTLALIKKEGNKWYNLGKYGYLCYVAVLPECSGKGVYRSLYQVAEATAKQDGLLVLTRDTHEKNERMLKIAKQEGYHYVDFRACADHFNIVRAKWLDNCSFPSWYIRIRYMFSRFFKKVRFKMDPQKGRIKRFGI